MILSVIVLLMLCLCVIMWFKTGEEASVGIFSLAVTLLGTIFIAIELKNGQNVTCSDMLINLNNYFHDSDRLMKVYDKLECHETDPKKCKALWSDVKEIEVAQYCTFFENLYLLYHNDIAEIEDLDDLFGYRFFTFIHNPYIQENHILPTSYSYIQIFKLYEAWIKYRRNSGGTEWKKRIPSVSNSFSEKYIKNRLYLHDHSDDIMPDPEKLCIKDQEFTLRRLDFKDLSEIIALQDLCVKEIGDASLYSPLTREELIESLHLDRIYGVFSASGELAAVSVCVSNRDSERNLARDFSLAPGESLTFDAVFVNPEFRGLGLHCVLIDRCIKDAEEQGIHDILSTVAPENTFSHNNFIRKGFQIVGSAEKYGGLKRNLYKLHIES